jgi:hypothetical protein
MHKSSQQSNLPRTTIPRYDINDLTRILTRVMKTCGISNACITASCILERMAKKSGIECTTRCGYLIKQGYAIRHVWNDIGGKLIDISNPAVGFEYFNKLPSGVDLIDKEDMKTYNKFEEQLNSCTKWITVPIPHLPGVITNVQVITDTSVNILYSMADQPLWKSIVENFIIAGLLDPI